MKRTKKRLKAVAFSCLIAFLGMQWLSCGRNEAPSPGDTPATTTPRTISKAGGVSRLTGVIMALFPTADNDHRAFAEECFSKLFEEINRLPSQEEIERISQEISTQAGLWKQFSDNVNFKDFVTSMQLMSYYYLTPPELDEEAKAELTAEREEMIEIMSGLVDRLIVDFGAPEEIRDEMELAGESGMKQLRDLLASDFLRSSQIPAGPAIFEKNKKDLLENIDTLGKEMQKEIRQAIEQAEERLGERKGKLLPRDFGASLLKSLSRTTQSYIGLCYGAAIRANLILRISQLEKETAFFPFGTPDTYWMRHKSQIGWIFIVTPKPRSEDPVKD